MKKKCSNNNKMYSVSGHKNKNVKVNIFMTFADVLSSGSKWKLLIL